IKFVQSIGSLGTCKFFQIVFAKGRPDPRVRMEPLTKGVRGRKFTQPGVYSSTVLADTAWTQAIHQHSCSICPSGFLVNSLNCNVFDRLGHGFALLLYVQVGIVMSV